MAEARDFQFDVQVYHYVASPSLPMTNCS